MLRKGLLALLALVMIINLHCARVMGARPNIVLLSIDTWRADYFTQEHMPRFYEFAQENCLVFTNAYANATWTMPSHTTMLSGILPGRHGVEYTDSIVPEEIPMVQEDLKRLGYKTFASTNRGFVSATRGFGRGFDVWEETRGTPPDHNTVETYLENVKKPFFVAEKQIANHRASSGPMFLFLHTFVVHNYRKYLEPMLKLERETVMRKPLLEALPDSVDKKFLAVLDESARDRRQRYKTVVSFMDDVLMDFIDRLLSGPLADNLVLIITTDHGEGLCDRYGNYVSIGHGNSPFPDQSRIPMIVYGLNARGETEGLMSLAEIKPMILAIAEGRTYSPPEREFLVLESIRENAGRSIGLVSGNEHYVWTYDGTSHLIVNGVHVDERVETERADISDDQVKELKALGYLN